MVVCHRKQVIDENITKAPVRHLANHHHNVERN